MSTQIHGNKLLEVSIKEKQYKLLIFEDKYRARPFFEPHALVEDINKQYETNLRVIPSKTINAMLGPHSKSDIWEKLLPFPVDMFIGYEAPGKRLGPTIVFSDRFRDKPKIVLQTDDYTGEKNVALVVSNLTLNDIVYTIGRKTRTLADFLSEKQECLEQLWRLLKKVETIQLIVPKEKITLVEDFPKRSGWYRQHLETGIPYGENVTTHIDNVIYLNRTLVYPYVGPVAYDRLGSISYLADIAPLGNLGIYVNYEIVGSPHEPTLNKLRVVAEVPPQDTAKIKTMWNKNGSNKLS